MAPDGVGDHDHLGVGVLVDQQWLPRLLLRLGRRHLLLRRRLRVVDPPRARKQRVLVEVVARLANGLVRCRLNRNAMRRPQFDRRSLAHLRRAILPSRGLGCGTAIDGEALQGLTLLWLVVALPCL